jgi:hypothetical protein
MNFNDLLLKEGIDPGKVISFRHRPPEPEVHKVLPWLAAERPELFNAYQQTQRSVRVENALASLSGSGYVASFLGREPGKALFIGLYSVAASRALTREAYLQVPAYKELRTFGSKLWFTEEVARERPTVQWFDLVPVDFYSQWKGKLVIGWPPPERSWWRRAENNEYPLLAVHEDSALDQAMPEWNAINLSWEELRVLPARWKHTLAQWRGVYHIFDGTDGKAYVGSAYGAANLLGRWLNYAATGDGGNKLLRARKPNKFQFSILELGAPDMKADEIVQIEARWKDRLHTRAPDGLNDN